MRKAVVDVGSNSVLLTVEEFDGDRWLPVFESSDVTALGEGTKETGLLGERGVSVTLAALKEAFGKAEELGVLETLAAVTMAGRIAKNTHDFLHQAAMQRTPVFVLSGSDEAELGFRAVADDPTFSQYDRLSIIDPGGHSTELVTADRTAGRWDFKFRKSFSIGTLGLKTDVMPDETPDTMQILKAVSLIDDTIGMAYRPNEAGHAVVLGATGTNLVSVREKLLTWQPEKVHGAYLDFEEISKAVGWMMPMTDVERAAIPGMEKGREKTIHIGALILERFLHAIKVLGCSVSVRGWRHALLENGLPEHPLN